MGARKNINIDTTKRGFPAMWESGGGMTSGGGSTIITGRNGEARRPVYMPRGGHLCCGNHALITVHDGFHVVNAGVSHGTRSSASIWRIVSTNVKDINGERWSATADVEELNSFSKGEWDQPLDERFVPAVEAAFRKAGSYHCRSAFYVDCSDKPAISSADQQKKAEAMRRQDEERARLRQEKAEREAQAKTEAEAASKAAKDAGLGQRLEVASLRLVAQGQRPIELGDVSFSDGWYSHPYTEQSVRSIERQADNLEAEQKEKAEKSRIRELFQPGFEAWQSRAEAAGLTVEYRETQVDCGYRYHEYSGDGIFAYEAQILIAEKALAEAKAKAVAEAVYQQRKAEAQAAGLPSDVRIWCRRGGRTNAGDGWVIDANGQDRDNTSWYNPRPRYSGEGDKIWEQILKGEVVLQWSKSCSAAEHVFVVNHLPAEGLTLAQKERILEIQDGLVQEWDGVRGMASNQLSPSIGAGWGLCKKAELPGEEISLEGMDAASQLSVLKARFNRN